MTKEEKNIYMRIYNRVNREKINAQRRARRKINIEKVLADKKAWYENNKEKVRIGNKKYRDANKDKCTIYHREYKKANKEKYRFASRKWRKNNPEKNAESARISSRKRRALKVGVGHRPYKDSEIFERDNWICGICGQKINKRPKFPHQRSKSIDHVIAIFNGGCDSPDNLQASHLRCNIGKGINPHVQVKLIR